MHTNMKSLYLKSGKGMAVAILFCIFCHLTVYSQQSREKACQIMSNPEYIYGEGWGETPADADKAALRNLLSKIGTQVESSFTLNEREANADGQLDSKSEVSNVLKTYSQATLNNTDVCYFNDGARGVCLIRYMLRAELEKMYAQRLDRVEDYVRTAMRAEQKGRVDDALRFYNWSYVLLHSLQYPSQVKMDIEGDEQLLINWIPRKMSGILDGISLSVARVGDDNTVDVIFNYRGKPAEGLDFTYWNGRFNSALSGVRSGIGQLNFPPDYKPEEVTVTIETKYAESAIADKELEIMMRNFNNLSFHAAKKSIGIPGKTLAVEKGAKKELQEQVSAEKRDGLTPLAKGDAKEYAAVVKSVLGSVGSNGRLPVDKSLFTPEGYEMFDALMGYGRASLIGNPEPGYYPFGDKVVCRSIPMKFSFANNHRTFIEEVTFTFDSEKRIESVAFGLGGAARRDIFAQGGDAWGDDVKMTIVSFLENYKTAFALKRLDYIKSIFDEDAYIIVGHKLQKVKRTGDDINGFSLGTSYSYQHKTKGEYMSHLAKCFASNEFVNINFSDNDVQKAAFGGNTFGIQIKQDYYSQHYGDQGYLFLFVDLNEPEQPVIKIRTWQPERQADITPMIPKSSRDHGIYGVYSFQ